MKLALSRVHYPVRSLGPGARLGIWFQGCSIRCRGCISVDTWAPNRGITSVDELFAVIGLWLSEAEGVTISGGEPFDQPQALQQLLAKIRATHNGDILVYSGYPLEALSSHISAMHGLFDAIITDPMDLSSSQTKALRGSDNQRLTTFTDLGEKRFQSFERRLNTSDHYLDVMFDDDSGEVWFAGIPRRGDFRKLTAALSATGHSVTTAEDKQ